MFLPLLALVQTAFVHEGMWNSSLEKELNHKLTALEHSIDHHHQTLIIKDIKIVNSTQACIIYEITDKHDIR